jgi:hypothetical protein
MQSLEKIPTGAEEEIHSSLIPYSVTLNATVAKLNELQKQFVNELKIWGIDLSINK